MRFSLAAVADPVVAAKTKRPGFLPEESSLPAVVTCVTLHALSFFHRLVDAANRLPGLLPCRLGSGFPAWLGFRTVAGETDSLLRRCQENRIIAGMDKMAGSTLPLAVGLMAACHVIGGLFMAVETEPVGCAVRHYGTVLHGMTGGALSLRHGFMDVFLLQGCPVPGMRRMTLQACAAHGIIHVRLDKCLQFGLVTAEAEFVGLPDKQGAAAGFMRVVAGSATLLQRRMKIFSAERIPGMAGKAELFARAGQQSRILGIMGIVAPVALAAGNRTVNGHLVSVRFQLPVAGITEIRLLLAENDHPY
jgi:hypothetical protein